MSAVLCRPRTAIAGKVQRDAGQPGTQPQLSNSLCRIALERPVDAHEHLLGDVFGGEVTDYPRGHSENQLLVVDDQVGKRLIEVTREPGAERVVRGDCHVHAGITQPAPHRLQFRPRLPR